MLRSLRLRAAVLVLAVVAVVPPAASAAAAAPPLVTRYAPFVYLHPLERSIPMAVEPFLAQAELSWAQLGRDARLAPEGAVDAARLGAACATAEDGCYRHGAFLSSDHTRPHDGGAPPSGGKGFYLDVDDVWLRRDDAQGAPLVYWERKPGSITYWFFYRDSIPPGVAGNFRHEGDWERIEVVLSAVGAATGVRFHQHNDKQPVPWDAVCKWRAAAGDCAEGATHPVVFVARGTHASYRDVGATRQCLTPHLCLTDRRDRGRAIHAWNALANVREQPWYGFGGAWGDWGRIKDTTGPLGPSVYKR